MLLIKQPENNICTLLKNVPLLELPNGKLIRNSPDHDTTHPLVCITDDAKWVGILVAKDGVNEINLAFTATFNIKNVIHSAPLSPYELWLQSVVDDVYPLVIAKIKETTPE